MTAAAAAPADGSGNAAPVDPCGGVSSGIADAISSGALDFGGQVSEMSYACSAPVEDEAAFAKAEEKQKEAEANGGTAGGNNAPLIIKPVVTNNSNQSNVSASNMNVAAKDESKKRMGQLVFGSVLVFSVVVFIVVLMYQYEMFCFKNRMTPARREALRLE